MIKRICVFTGSSPGTRAEYEEAAKGLGRALVENEIELVYGGGDVGLMGIIADTVMNSGGRVTGVIPEFLFKKEIANNEIIKLYIVRSMHERKAMMSELSDGFIAMPGGIGTFEELFEIMTWRQLGVQIKPCALLNTCNYFEHLLGQLEHAVCEGFLKPLHRDMLIVGTEPNGILAQMADQPQEYEDKWLEKV